MPQYYAERVHAKLEQVRQGNRTPDVCYKKLRTLIFRSNLHFPNRYVISKFVNGLNVDLKSVVSMQHFVRGTGIEEVLHYTNHVYKNLPQRRQTGFHSKPWQSTPSSTTLSQRTRQEFMSEPPSSQPKRDAPLQPRQEGEG